MKNNKLFSLYIFAPLLVALASCASMETKLDNPETDYNKYPLEASHNFLKPGVGMNGYSLSLEKSITKETDLPSVNLLNLIFKDDATFSGGKYAFLKGTEKLCDVYIYRKSDMKKNGGLTTGTVQRYITVVKSKGDVRAYELVDSFGSGTFLSVSEKDAAIEFARYGAKENGVGAIITSPAGYKISVNGKPYGIIGFYKTPALYELKSAALGDGALKDAVMMWVLAVYEDYTIKSAP